MATPAFIIYRSAVKGFCFLLTDDSAAPVLHLEKIEAYMACINTIILVKSYAGFEASFHKRKLPDGEGYYFEMQGTLGKLIGNSEMYQTEGERDVAIQKVQQCAPHAAIEDLTDKK